MVGAGAGGRIEIAMMAVIEKRLGSSPLDSN